MCLNDVLDDRQPESGSAHRPAPGPIATVEAFKEAGQMLLADAAAGIDNRDRNRSVLRFAGCSGLDHDSVSLMAVLDGVDQQIDHGLLQEGVAASTRQDGQAKGLGEWLRSRIVDLPLELVGG